MKAMIVGKERKSGVKKDTGEMYDNVFVHVTCKKLGVEGLAVESFRIKAVDYDPNKIVVGQYCEYDRDNRGYLCAFDMVGK